LDDDDELEKAAFVDVIRDLDLGILAKDAKSMFVEADRSAGTRNGFFSFAKFWAVLETTANPDWAMIAALENENKKRAGSEDDLTMSDEPICNDRGEYTLFVSGLPWEFVDESLVTFYMSNKFYRSGDVSVSRVCMDHDSGMCRGFGFVSYRDAESAKKAQKFMDGFATGFGEDGRAIKCAYYDATDPPKELGRASQRSYSPYRLARRRHELVDSSSDEEDESAAAEGEKTEEAEVCVKKAEEPNRCALIFCGTKRGAVLFVTHVPPPPFHAQSNFPYL
jgi:RNA recognition motif-containing protein